MRAVLLDTQGPEIRTTKLASDSDGKTTVSLTTGDIVTISSSDDLSTALSINVSLPSISTVLSPGDTILLDDGAVSLSVTSTSPMVQATVLNDGQIRSRVGVNLPGVKTSLPAMSDKDLVDIRYGVENDVDYVAASFVRDAAGVRQIKDYLAEVVSEVCPGCSPPLVISKIENVEGLENFDEILKESDGIMVARGDLGVEIPLHEVRGWGGGQ